MYKRLTDTTKELDGLYNKGLQRGYSIGWDWELLPLTIKLGTTSYIAAPPHQGKTEFWFEILINLSCLHKLKHIIFSPETGNASEIFAELCSKFVGKPYYGKNKMSGSDKVYAEMFINDHFVIIDPSDEDITIEQYYTLVDQIENEQGIKFATTTIDPWNELKEVLIPEDMGREDKYLSRILGYSRKNARTKNRHNCIINHVRDQQTITESGISYNPIPTARDFAGGQVWFRKGMLMIILWRPPYGLANAEGKPYKETETLVKIAKSKPKGVSKNGLNSMHFDVDRISYYVENDRGQRIYADRGEYNNKEKVKEPEQITIETAIKPNMAFDAPIEIDNNNSSDWFDTRGEVL
jgi:hypothetical protein